MKTNEILKVKPTLQWITRRAVTVLFNMLIFVHLSYGDDFSARHLGDFGNVTVMEVSGNYDARKSDGSVNASPRQSISKEYFRFHKDEYDFVVVFTNFDFKMPEADADGFYEGTKNDIKGIGRVLFDNTALYGSNGRLQGTIDMGNLAGKASNPLAPGFDTTLRVLVHEMQHRWGSYVRFKDAAGNVSSALLGKDAAHWSYLQDTKGSVMYGSQWQDNGNGTFTAVAEGKYYSPLDLYLMGMIDRFKVPPILLIENPSVDPTKTPEAGVTITGRARYVTIDDIVAVEGERTPNSRDSQKQFKTAFIYAVSPNSFNGDDLYRIENIRNGLLTRFSILTDGKGLVQVTSTPRDDLATNPGVNPPLSTPRTLPPNIDSGVTWLLNRQQADGNWTDCLLTTERDTAEVVTTLQNFPIAAQSFQAGSVWLGSNSAANTDYLARRIESVVQTAGNSSSLVQELLARRNRDGGWGSNRNFISSAADTALALKALAVAGYSDSSVTGPAIAYLQGTQNADGGWSGDDAFSTIQPTAAVVTAFNSYRKTADLDARLTRAVAFLTAKQNPDSGFGNSPSTVYDSALAVIALQAAGADKSLAARGVSYLLGQQSDNGAWFDSPYQTALAVRAVWAATVDPDLSIKPEDISVIPATITTLPTNAVLSATVRNLGRSDISRATVAVYDGLVTTENKVAEQTAAFPGQAPVTLTFQIPVTDSKGHVFHVVVDPDNLLPVESDKNNNHALKPLIPELTYDFQVLASDITVTPNPADMGRDVTVTVKLSNIGTSDAYNVPVRLFIDQPGAPLEIATLSVDVPAGGSTAKETAWKAGLAGSSLPLTVQIDPNGTFTETNKDNNSASVPLTVNASTLPNLTVSYRDMTFTPDPVREGGNASLSVLVKNDGYSAVENVRVSFYNGTASNGGTLLGSRIIPTIAAGQSVQAATDWIGIAVSGGQLITVQVEPVDNSIQEITTDDNFTFLNLDILSLPDLAVSSSSVAINPATPKSGDPVAIAVTVQNGGEQEARDVIVEIREGGTVICSTVIPLVNGNSQATAILGYSNAGQTGTHQITVTVAPDAAPGNLIVERTKDNNSVVKTFSIQDSNLWLTESYISPNGDGIKDSTDFSYRLAAPAKVSVQVVNKKGGAIRTFSGGELDNTAGATITWDGRSDAGVIVADGDYQIRLVSQANALLASLQVIVDNNRSPLADAIGTKYLLQNNMTCQIPASFWKWGWFPQDSGVWFNNDYAMPNFSSGLYQILASGEDLRKITPDNWSDNNYDYLVDSDSAISSGASSLAFGVWKKDKLSQKQTASIWVKNLESGNIKEVIGGIDAFDIYELKWSPDAKKLVIIIGIYTLQGYRDYQLRIIDAETSNMFTAEVFYGYGLSNVEWSLDSKSLAFFSNTHCNADNSNCEHTYESLRIADVDSGAIRIIRTSDRYNNGFGNLKWLADGMLLAEEYPYYTMNRLLLFDTINQTPFRIIQDESEYPVYKPIYGVHPDHKSIALISQRTSGSDVSRNLNLIGLDGGVIPVGDMGVSFRQYSEGPTDYPVTPIWSESGDKLAYVERELRSVENKVYENLVVYDRAGRSSKKYTIAVSNPPIVNTYSSNEPIFKVNEISAWLSDKVSILIDTFDGYIAVNTDDGTISSALPVERGWNDPSLSVSTNQRYITYFKYNSTPGSCAKESGYDIWTISTLLNLTADLRISKFKTYVTLRGIVSDKNLEGYRLEYADVKMPGTWNLIAPPSDIPVLNNNFTTWVPPYEGSFLIRLTAWDKAGNQAIDRKRLNWGMSSSITNLYMTEEYFSPNGDGVKEVVEMHYQVLEPVHLEFNIYDSNNNLVRAFSREYTDPISDFILWDGKDSAGRVVTDGQYRISVFDYDFFVKVDSTLPSASIAFDKLEYVNDPPDSAGGTHVKISLVGHATDNNIKKWLIESGEGDNPQTWYRYSEGSNGLAAGDNQVIQKNAAISTFTDDEIGPLKGKRFRITVEDFAGNRSSMLTEYVEERVMFSVLNGTSIVGVNQIGIDIFKSDLAGGKRLISAIETVRLPTASRALQYKSNSEWHNSGAIEKSTNGGDYTLEWDTNPLNFQSIDAIRMKVVDVFGGVHLSREIPLIDQAYFNAAVECDQTINVSYNEPAPLGDVTLQISRDHGGTWSTVSTQSYSNVKIVATAFQVPAELYNATDFGQLNVRMVARASNGLVYFTTPELFPRLCKDVTLKVSVSYEEATTCNNLSPGKAKVDVNVSTLGNTLDSLKVTMKIPDGERLLQNFGQSPSGSVIVDTSSLPEGRYPVTTTVAYSYVSSGNVKREEKKSETTIIVNRSLPQAQFTYPSGTGLFICPVKHIDSNGIVKYGVDIEGVADSGVGIKYYDIYKGAGSNPADWTIASTLNGGVFKGTNSVRGSLGSWDVTGYRGYTYALQLRATDNVGNLSCTTTSFYLNEPVRVASIAPDRLLISSNIGDTVGVGYQLTGPATVGIRVFPVLSSLGKPDTLGSPASRTIAGGLHYLSGIENTSWDGRSDGGAILPDGKYGLTLNAVDACQLTDTKWATIEIDNKPPDVAISYPRPIDPLPTGNIIEVKGTATDMHFKTYLLEAGEGANPSDWVPISRGNRSVSDGKFTAWNTFGLKDKWTLRLTADDAAGNTSVTTSTIDLGTRKDLIKSFAITPEIFSPNGDLKRDITHIAYEVTDACQIRVDVLNATGIAIKTFITTTAAAVKGSFDWDGKINVKDTAADGVYTIHMLATLTGRPEVFQDENLSLTLDTVAPLVIIPVPADKAYYNNTEMPIIGSIMDLNLLSYSLSVTAPNGTAVLDTGNQNRTGYSFGSITNLNEDTYTLTIDTIDQGENLVKTIRTFTIDLTPPNVSLDTPKSGEFYGAGKNVDISGSVVEKNLDRYSLRYGVGESPIEWKELVGGGIVPTISSLFSWKVGKDVGIADGVYTLSLYAKDKAGLEGEAKVKLVLDNTLPEVAISQPINGSYLTKATDIKGTLNDINLSNGQLELAEGGCASAAKWAVVKTITASIQNGVLDSWKVLPTDGEFCLRLSAVDKSGNKAETKIGFTIDTRPPSPPQLTGKTEGKTANSLNWTRSPETDTASYNVYRNGQKLNTSSITTDLTYSDAGLKEGSYIYTVKAVDLAGNESAPSNVVTLKIDLTGPTVRISTPIDGAVVSNLVEVKGTAYSQDDFNEYRLYIGQGSSPSNWTLIRRSPLPISFGSLAQWDTIFNQEGSQYTLKLEGEDTSGNISTTQVIVAIDNTPPNRPSLLSAIGNESGDVTLTWNANSDSDLAGYLLHRNDQLANVTGIVAGNLKPYLLTGTAYIDKALPDGTYGYYLVAMDQAGNNSEQSTPPLVVNIDTHPPHMTITEPAIGFRFEAKIAIKAETPDNDIATVQFQYKHPQDPETAWTDLGQKFVKAPYITYFDPKSNSLSYGDFQLRAFATDQHNNYDLAPQVVTVTYTDLTPPDVPSGLAAKVIGADVNLTWNAISEADASYNVYRWSGGTKSKIDSVPVKTASFTDTGVPDGTYQYEITAIDVAGNASKASGQVTAKIYAPLITQPFTPVKESALNLSGSGVDPGALVQITATLPSGATSSVTVNADSAGTFRQKGITLVLGENRFTAIATDNAGNISRGSETIVVVYDVPPNAPTGLAAAVQGYDVQLTWDPNRETVLGYNVYRDGYKQNQSVVVTDGLATAYNEEHYTPAQNALDGNNYTYWSTPYGDGTFTPTWLQATLPAPEVISQVVLQWGQGGWDNVNNRYIILGGKDYELQAWTGYNWITLKKVVGNDQQYNQLEISPPYRTDRLRIAIASTTDPGYSKYVWIKDIKIFKDALVQPTAYADLGLWDQRFKYTVSAVGRYGLESAPSAPVEAIVGDVIPPAAPTNLQAAVNDADITLDWSTTPNSEPDLAGYYIYRQNGQEWDFWDDVSNTTTTYTDPYLPNGTYHYKITAYDSAYNESVPSNDASAAVAFAPPSNPPVLSVTAPPEGKAIIASWQASGGTAVAYNVYRSQSSGDGYVKISTSPLKILTYKDSGLVNGTTYFYRVTAVDAVGNESLPSNIASGIPQDMTTVQPLILWPTVAGSPFVVRKNGVTVGGYAEPASQIDIMRDGSLLGSVTASLQDVQSDASISISAHSAALSSDGEALAMVDYSGQLLLSNRKTNVTVSVPAVGFYYFTSDTLQWSPDGRFLLVSVYDYSWRDKIAIYDRDLEQIKLLTAGETTYEWGPSWSENGDAVVFAGRDTDWVNGIWKVRIKDQTITLLAGGVGADNPKLSPVGDRVAYVDDTSLKLLNITDGSISLIDDQSDWRTLAWSPDGSKLAYISYRDGGNGDFYVFSTAAGSSTRLTTSGLDGYYAAWSPESDQLAYVAWGDSGEVVHILHSDGIDRQISQSTSDIYGLEWHKSGELTYIDTMGIHNISFAGTFNLPNAQLVPGENHLVAISTDTSGNRSIPSDPITVVFDIGYLPDLVITDSDITIFPPYPKPGEDVLVTARIHNPTANAVENIKAELYLWDGSNAVTTLASDTILHIDAYGEGAISARFNAGTAIGMRTLIAIADPDNTNSELLENNNYGIKDLVVTSQELITLSTSLNAAHFAANSDLNAVVTVRNSGMTKGATIIVTVEDTAGTQVKLLDSRSLEVAYGSDQKLTYAWNTTAILAGSYRLHAVLLDGATVLADSASPFTIMPDLRVSAGIVSDRQQYVARQDVGLAVSLRNIGVNYLIPQLRARVRVLGPQGTELFSGEQAAVGLMPGSSASLSFSWNTGFTAPGEYTAVLDVFSGETSAASSSTGFTVIPSVAIGGSIAADPGVALIGSGFAANYSLTGNGNAGASGTAVVSLIDPDTLTVVATSENAVVIPMGGTVSGSAPLATTGLRLKNYLLRLSFLSQGNSTVIAVTPFSVKDGTPPVLNVMSPKEGVAYAKILEISINATDNASGVDKVEYRIDSGNWMPLPLADPALGTYSTVWAPHLDGYGPHTIAFRGSDRAANTGPPVSVSCVIINDVDTTPPLAIAAPAGGMFNVPQSIKLTANEAAAIRFTTDGSIPTADSALYQAPITVTATTSLRFLAVDTAGNQSDPITEIYTIDTTPPVLNISTLPDSSFTNNEVLNVSGTVTDNVGVKELLINGSQVPFDSEGKFSQALLLKPGENFVNVTAADLATNQSSDNRTITLDQAVPLLTVNSPADNIKTNMPFIDVSGSVEDQGTAVVEVSLKGVPQAVTRDGRSFSATVALVPGSDVNTIDIKATDLAVNSSSDKRSVYYDDQSPALAITAPQQDIRTNQTILTIHGTASDPYGFGVAVTLEMNGQTFTPPLVDGTFEQAVTFTTEDTYTVVASATNEAGTSASVQRNIIYDVTPPVLTIDPVVSPTTSDSQTVSGTRESGTDVTVSSATATVGTVTYPTATAWQMTISGLKQGSNIITTSSSDAAKNVATAFKEIVYTVSTSSGDFSFAIFGNAKVTMSGGSYTDSYINSPSNWIKGNNRNGDVGTNSLQSCGIQMSGGVQVFGKGLVGQGGDPLTVECLNGGSFISGGSAALAVAKDMTPKTDPSGGTSLGAIALSGHKTRTLTAGDWRVSSISLSGESTLILNGPITLHVDGNLSLFGNSSIVIASGVVTIYQNGQKLDISGGSIVNTSKAPANLVIYGTAGGQNMNLSGGTDLHALVYAPTASIKLSGGQNTFGSIIGNTVDISGGSSVHYDEALRN